MHCIYIHKRKRSFKFVSCTFCSFMCVCVCACGCLCVSVCVCVGVFVCARVHVREGRREKEMLKHANAHKIISTNTLTRDVCLVNACIDTDKGKDIHMYAQKHTSLAGILMYRQDSDCIYTHLHSHHEYTCANAQTNNTCVLHVRSM